MKKCNKVLIFGVLGFILFSSFWFNFYFIESNTSFFKEKLYQAGQESDVIIVYNPGGWGTIPFEKALDFNPIINEIKNKIEEQNYTVSIVGYQRTQESLLGKIGSIREFLFNYPKTSKSFAETIDNFLNENPDNKVVVAGLSNGAIFVSSAMEKLNQKDNDVFSIGLGAPFWENKTKGDNILRIINNNDILANKNTKELILSLLKTPFAWAYSNIKGERISFSNVIDISGHKYYWKEIGAKINSFLEHNFSEKSILAN